VGSRGCVVVTRARARALRPAGAKVLVFANFPIQLFDGGEVREPQVKGVGLVDHTQGGWILPLQPQANLEDGEILARYREGIPTVMQRYVRRVAALTRVLVDQDFAVARRRLESSNSWPCLKYLFQRAQLERALLFTKDNQLCHSVLPYSGPLPHHARRVLSAIDRKRNGECSDAPCPGRLTGGASCEGAWDHAWEKSSLARSAGEVAAQRTEGAVYTKGLAESPLWRQPPPSRA